MRPKYLIFRDEEYLREIRKKDCLSCGTPGPSEAHHVWHSGKKNHGNDYLAIPLCHECHISGPRAYHKLEHDLFEEIHCLDLKDEIINSLCNYIAKLRGANE